jgi:hypothetical protein
MGPLSGRFCSPSMLSDGKVSGDTAQTPHPSLHHPITPSLRHFITSSLRHFITGFTCPAEEDSGGEGPDQAWDEEAGPEPEFDPVMARL